MSLAAQMKKEKKIVEEKVEKVRQVVPTVSKNDIILALHNYDMDVQRTIQAFCEEGKQGALGDWESTGKPKKAKKSTKTENTTSNVATASKTQPKQNGYTNNGLSATSVTPTSSSSTSKNKKPPQKVNQTSNLENINRLSGTEKNKALTSEVSRVNLDLTEAQKLFETELRNAENSIAQCFKEIRQAAAERERQLLHALNQVRSDGNLYLTNRRSAARQLQEISDVEKLASEMKQFLSLKQQDTDLAHTTRFVYDNSKLIRNIGQFGEIVSVNGEAIQPPPVVSNTTSDIKHATSHSSIVSSVGEDSGLGQISPVSNGKHLNTVDNGGIAMRSDALSTDQLAEIQRQVAERLKAQGIDPSVLASAGAPVPPRRRNPQNNSNKKPAQKGGNKKNQQNSQIQLSILH